MGDYSVDETQLDGIAGDQRGDETRPGDASGDDGGNGHRLGDASVPIVVAKPGSTVPRAISMVTRSGWEILLVIGVVTSPCLAISTGEQLGGGIWLHVATGAQHGSGTRPGDAAGDATGEQGGDDIRLGHAAQNKPQLGADAAGD